MTGYAPPWLFAVLTAAATLGFAACGVRVVLRPPLTGVVFVQGGSDREAWALVSFWVVGALAATFWVVGALATTFWVVGA